MANLLSRVTGNVLRVQSRSGKNAETGNEWAMDIATILIGTHGTSDIILPRSEDIAKTIGQKPLRGDSVDWVIETRNGAKGLNTSVLGLYEDAL